MPEAMIDRSSRALVRVPAPEERVYQQLLLAIEIRQCRIAARRTDLARLSDALDRFAQDVLGEVDALFDEIARVRAEIARQRRRLTDLRNGAAPQDDQEEPVDGEASDAGESSPWASDDGDGWQAPPLRSSPRRLAAADEAEARRLYRDLAKRHHPDLTQVDEERQQRATLMLRVNAAFRERDLDTLRELHRAEVPVDGGGARSLQDRLAWARREVSRLDELLATLAADHAALLASDAHALWRRHEIGEDVVESLEMQLAAQLTTHRARLAELVRACRRLGDREAA